MKLAPIAIFTYNRYSHLKRTIEALQRNYLAKESEIFIFSDGAKSESDMLEVQKVRDYISCINGFKKVNIVKKSSNLGLAQSIITGVSEIINRYGSIIVLEDDLETSPFFLDYMNLTLQNYSPDNVWSIAGYSPTIQIPESYVYETFLAFRNCSWGWATWKQNWNVTDWDVKDFNEFFINKENRNSFEKGGNDLSIMLLKQMNNQINSWSIRFNYAGYKYNLPTVYPTNSFVRNIGVDGSGTNMKKSERYKTQLSKNKVNVQLFSPNNNVNLKIACCFKSFYNTSLYRRAINWFKIRQALYKIKRGYLY